MASLTYLVVGAVSWAIGLQHASQASSHGNRLLEEVGERASRQWAKPLLAPCLLMLAELSHIAK